MRPDIIDESSPVIIIAAARSGTKMLRSALATSSELVDFPYDINYIWKYGNYHIPHDELTKDQLTDGIKSFIRKQFSNLLCKSNAKRVLEKTVSNSLRVDFVREVFPDCQIIHLYRDGRDVADSARLCWQSPMLSDRIQPKSVLLRKFIHFPIIAGWPYLLNYISNYSINRFSKPEHVKSWGPRFENIDAYFKKYSLLQVCGIQWAKSIESSLKILSCLKENEEYLNVRYEDVVNNPVNELRRIADFLHIKDFGCIEEYAKNKITNRYVDGWRDALSSYEIERLLPHIGQYLKLLGYEL